MVTFGSHPPRLEHRLPRPYRDPALGLADKSMRSSSGIRPSRGLGTSRHTELELLLVHVQEGAHLTLPVNVGEASAALRVVGPRRPHYLFRDCDRCLRSCVRRR